MDKLSHVILHTTLELEQTKVVAKQKLGKINDKLIILRNYLTKVITPISNMRMN